MTIQLIKTQGGTTRQRFLRANRRRDGRHIPKCDATKNKKLENAATVCVHQQESRCVLESTECTITANGKVVRVHQVDSDWVPIMDTELFFSQYF
jgi:hypothetical protein